ncbi:hypothetical protein [Candidatus Mesenet endosymbiont of Phosphuga atrata]|uniref:hypothetical protein n=1 Tax=Candidatus Mesenet endosymbiont of Phosphuga atrata TaxID=3066221 RepID=UPI0030D541A4
MFETIFNLIKFYSKSVRSSKGKQLIKAIKKDVTSAYNQNLFILDLFNMHSKIDNHIGKILKIERISTKEQPNLKLEKINITEKGKEITR